MPRYPPDMPHLCASSYSCSSQMSETHLPQELKNNKLVPSCCPTSPPHLCNCGNDHTTTFKEGLARPGPTGPTRPTSPGPPGQDPMDMAVNGIPAPSPPPASVGPTVVHLVIPRQPPPARPPCPSSTQGFGSPLLLEGQSPSPAPSDVRARRANH